MNIQQYQKQKTGESEQKIRKKLVNQNIQLHKQIFQLQKQVNEVLTKKQAKKIKNQQRQKQLTNLYGEQIQEQQKKIRRLKQQVYYLKSSNAKMNIQYINMEQSELLILIKEKNQLIRQKELLKNFIQDKKQELSKNNGLDTHKKNLQNQYTETKKINQKYSAQIVQLQRQVRKYHLLSKNIKQLQNKKTQIIDFQNVELQIQQTVNLIFKTKNQIKQIEDKWKPNIDSLNTEYFSLSAEEKDKKLKMQKLQKQIKIFQHRSKSLRDQTDIFNDRSRLAKVTVSSSLGFSRSTQKKNFKESKFIEQGEKKEKVKAQFILKELQNFKAKKIKIGSTEKEMNINLSVNSQNQQKFQVKYLTKDNNKKIQKDQTYEKSISNQTELKISTENIKNKPLISKKSNNFHFQSNQQKQNQYKSSPMKLSSKIETDTQQIRKSPKQKLITKFEHKNQRLDDQKISFVKKINKPQVQSKEQKSPKKHKKYEQLQSSKNHSSIQNFEKKKDGLNQFTEKPVIEKNFKKSYTPKRQSSQKQNFSKETENSNKNLRNKIKQVTQNQPEKLQKKLKKKRSQNKELKQQIQIKQGIEKPHKSKKSQQKNVEKKNKSIENLDVKNVQRFQIKLENKITVKKQQEKHSIKNNTIKKQVNSPISVDSSIKIQKSQVVQVNNINQIQIVDNKKEQIQQLFKPYLIKRKRPGGSLNFNIINENNKQKQNLLLLIQKQSIGVGSSSIG